MRKLLFFTIISTMILAACGGSPINIAPVEPQTFDLPGDLPQGFIRTQAENTEWFVKGIEGVYDEASGWTEFEYASGGSIRAIWRSTPNPSAYGQDFAFEFDIQWVNPDGFIMEHAECFSITAFNEELETDKNPQRNYEYYEEVNQNYNAKQSTIRMLGCNFGEGEDVIYGIHRHWVETNAGIAKEVTTPVPDLPEFTGGFIPYSCGSQAILGGTVDWSKVANFSADCERGIYSFIFRGDDVSQLPVDLWFDQANAQLMARTNIRGCVVSGARVLCESYGFDVEVFTPNGNMVQANVVMPEGCGSMAFTGSIDWSKIRAASFECKNSRLRLFFRGENMDGIHFYIEVTRDNPNTLDGYTNLVGCQVGGIKAVSGNSAWVDGLTSFDVSCPDYGVSLSVSHR